MIFASIKCIMFLLNRSLSYWYVNYNDYSISFFLHSWLWFWQCLYDLSIYLDPIHFEMLYLPPESHQQGVMFEFLAIKRKRRKQKYGHSTIFYWSFFLREKNRRDLKRMILNIPHLQDCKNIKCVWLSVKKSNFR